ncbi:p2xD, partial [Symbiodinium sp. KB8]
ACNFWHPKHRVLRDEREPLPWPVPQKADNSSCSCPWRNFTNYRYVDGVGGTQTYPDNIVINTFRHEYIQERNASCGQDGCSKLWITSGVESRFMADIEDFTVLVAHALQSEERADHDFRKVLPGCSGLFIAGEMPGWLLVNGSSELQHQLCRSTNTSMTEPIYGSRTDKAPCYIKPNNTAKDGLDFFNVRTLMMAGDSVQAQLDRMTFHCDAARREARRCQILLQQSIADRDVLRKQLEDTRGERDALHSRIHDLLDQLTRAKQSIQTSRPPCNMVLLDGSEHLSELAVHKGLAVMNARLRGEAGSGFIAACDVSDAWSELGTAQRYPDTRKTFVCADILAGMSVCVAGANLCVGGLGSVYHSGGGIFLVSALKRFAWERSSERNFLMPKDLAAERFVRPFVWKLHALGSNKLTEVMRKSLDLPKLQEQLKAKRAKRSKRGTKGLRQQIKLAKLSEKFWALPRLERESILSKAGVYIFLDEQQDRGGGLIAPVSFIVSPCPPEAIGVMMPLCAPGRCDGVTKSPPSGKYCPTAGGHAHWKGANPAVGHASSKHPSGLFFFGAKTIKPAALWRWSDMDEAQPPFLQLVCGKDQKGQCLYAVNPIEASATARQLQKHLSVEDLYSRMPLFFSPSRTIELPPKTKVSVVDDLTKTYLDINNCEVKACLTDAVAEIGPALAEKMGLFRTSRPDFARTRLFYHAVQFRGILQVGDTAVLVKGMLVVNPSLGNKLVLRRSCVKCQWQPDSDSGLTYGLDVVQTTYGTQGGKQKAAADSGQGSSFTASDDLATVELCVQAMGLSLDGESYSGSGHSLRYEGLTVTLKIKYFDTWPWHGVLLDADRKPLVSYVYSLSPLQANPYKVSDVLYSDYPAKRRRRDMHGIYLSAMPDGELGVFDLQTLLVTLTTSLTLLALAATAVKYVAMYFLKQRRYYKEMLIQVSADFSDVRDLEGKSDEEIQEIMKDKGLPNNGSRIQKILAILEAGGLSHHNHSEPARVSVSENGGQARLLESGDTQMRLR